MKAPRKCKLSLAALCLLAIAAGAAERLVATKPAGMALVPAGVYTPLFRADQDPKTIPVAAFYLDTVPVSNADFLDFVRENPKWRRSQAKRLFAESDYLKHWRSDLELGSNAPARSPVIYVSWFAAKAYASSKEKRLPSTVEWEYAANASPSRIDGQNDPAFISTIRAWYASPTPAMLPSIRQGVPNYFGVYDLHGLVWEWVADFNTAMVTGDARADSGLDRQLFCGSGSEGATDRNNFPAFMRYGFRSSLKASYTVHNLGFRCAKDL